MGTPAVVPLAALSLGEVLFACPHVLAEGPAGGTEALVAAVYVVTGVGAVVGSGAFVYVCVEENGDLIVNIIISGYGYYSKSIGVTHCSLIWIIISISFNNPFVFNFKLMSTILEHGK